MKSEQCIMPDQEEINQHRKLLKAHRERLAHYLLQLANFGSAHAPPGVGNGIAEARDEIRHSKKILREWGVLVEDLPDDEDQTSYSGDDRENTHVKIDPKLLENQDRDDGALPVLSIPY